MVYQSIYQSSDDALEKNKGKNITFYSNSNHKILTGTFLGFEECYSKGKVCGSCKGYVHLNNIVLHMKNYSEKTTKNCFCISFHYAGAGRRWTVENNSNELNDIKKYLKETKQIPYEHEKRVTYANAGVDIDKGEQAVKILAEKLSKRSIEKISEDGNYQILDVDEFRASSGKDLLKIVCKKDDSDVLSMFFVELKENISERSNLGKLMKRYGSDTENWIGMTITVRMKEIEGKRAIIIL